MNDIFKSDQDQYDFERNQFLQFDFDSLLNKFDVVQVQSLIHYFEKWRPIGNADYFNLRLWIKFLEKLHLVLEIIIYQFNLSSLHSLANDEDMIKCEKLIVCILKWKIGFLKASFNKYIYPSAEILLSLLRKCHKIISPLALETIYSLSLPPSNYNHIYSFNHSPPLSLRRQDKLTYVLFEVIYAFETMGFSIEKAHSYSSISPHGNDELFIGSHRLCQRRVRWWMKYFSTWSEKEMESTDRVDFAGNILLYKHYMHAFISVVSLHRSLVDIKDFYYYRPQFQSDLLSFLQAYFKQNETNEANYDKNQNIKEDKKDLIVPHKIGILTLQSIMAIAARSEEVFSKKASDQDKSLQFFSPFDSILQSGLGLSISSQSLGHQSLISLLLDRHLAVYRSIVLRFNSVASSYKEPEARSHQQDSVGPSLIQENNFASENSSIWGNMSPPKLLEYLESIAHLLLLVSYVLPFPKVAESLLFETNLVIKLSDVVFHANNLFFFRDYVCEIANLLAYKRKSSPILKFKRHLRRFSDEMYYFIESIDVKLMWHFFSIESMMAQVIDMLISSEKASLEMFFMSNGFGFLVERLTKLASTFKEVDLLSILSSIISSESQSQQNFDLPQSSPIIHDTSIDVDSEEFSWNNAPPPPPPVKDDLCSPHYVEPSLSISSTHSTSTSSKHKAQDLPTMESFNFGSIKSSVPFQAYIRQCVSFIVPECFQSLLLSLTSTLNSFLAQFLKSPQLLSIADKMENQYPFWHYFLSSNLGNPIFSSASVDEDFGGHLQTDTFRNCIIEISLGYGRLFSPILTEILATFVSVIQEDPSTPKNLDILIESKLIATTWSAVQDPWHLLHLNADFTTYVIDLMSAICIKRDMGHRLIESLNPFSLILGIFLDPFAQKSESFVLHLTEITELSQELQGFLQHNPELSTLCADTLVTIWTQVLDSTEQIIDKRNYATTASSFSSSFSSSGVGDYLANNSPKNPSSFDGNHSADMDIYNQLLPLSICTYTLLKSKVFAKAFVRKDGFNLLLRCQQSMFGSHIPTLRVLSTKNEMSSRDSIGFLPLRYTLESIYEVLDTGIITEIVLKIFEHHENLVLELKNNISSFRLSLLSIKKSLSARISDYSFLADLEVLYRRLSTSEPLSQDPRHILSLLSPRLQDMFLSPKLQSAFQPVFRVLFSLMKIEFTVNSITHLLPKVPISSLKGGFIKKLTLFYHNTQCLSLSCVGELSRNLNLKRIETRSPQISSNVEKKGTKNGVGKDDLSIFYQIYTVPRANIHVKTSIYTPSLAPIPPCCCSHRRTPCHQCKMDINHMDLSDSNLRHLVEPDELNGNFATNKYSEKLIAGSIFLAQCRHFNGETQFQTFYELVPDFSGKRKYIQRTFHGLMPNFEVINVLTGSEALQSFPFANPSSSSSPKPTFRKQDPQNLVNKPSEPIDSFAAEHISDSAFHSCSVDVTSSSLSLNQSGVNILQGLVKTSQKLLLSVNFLLSVGDKIDSSTPADSFLAQVTLWEFVTKQLNFPPIEHFETPETLDPQSKIESSSYLKIDIQSISNALQLIEHMGYLLGFNGLHELNGKNLSLFWGSPDVFHYIHFAHPNLLPNLLNSVFLILLLPQHCSHALDKCSSTYKSFFQDSQACKGPSNRSPMTPDQNVVRLCLAHSSKLMNFLGNLLNFTFTKESIRLENPRKAEDFSLKTQLMHNLVSSTPTLWRRFAEAPILAPQLDEDHLDPYFVPNYYIFDLLNLMHYFDKMLRSKRNALASQAPVYDIVNMPELTSTSLTQENTSPNQVTLQFVTEDDENIQTYGNHTASDSSGLNNDENFRVADRSTVSHTQKETSTSDHATKTIKIRRRNNEPVFPDELFIDGQRVDLSNFQQLINRSCEELTCDKIRVLIYAMVCHRPQSDQIFSGIFNCKDASYTRKREACWDESDHFVIQWPKRLLIREKNTRNRAVFISQLIELYVSKLYLPPQDDKPNELQGESGDQREFQSLVVLFFSLLSIYNDTNTALRNASFHAMIPGRLRFEDCSHQLVGALFALNQILVVYVPTHIDPVQQSLFHFLVHFVAHSFSRDDYHAPTTSQVHFSDRQDVFSHSLQALFPFLYDSFQMTTGSSVAFDNREAIRDILFNLESSHFSRLLHVFSQAYLFTSALMDNVTLITSEVLQCAKSQPLTQLFQVIQSSKERKPPRSANFRDSETPIVNCDLVLASLEAMLISDSRFNKFSVLQFHRGEALFLRRYWEEALLFVQCVQGLHLPSMSKKSYVAGVLWQDFSLDFDQQNLVNSTVLSALRLLNSLLLQLSGPEMTMDRNTVGLISPSELNLALQGCVPKLPDLLFNQKLFVRQLSTFALYCQRLFSGIFEAHQRNPNWRWEAFMSQASRLVAVSVQKAPEASLSYSEDPSIPLFIANGCLHRLLEPLLVRNPPKYIDMVQRLFHTPRTAEERMPEHLSATFVLPESSPSADWLPGSEQVLEALLEQWMLGILQDCQRLLRLVSEADNFDTGDLQNVMASISSFLLMVCELQHSGSICSNGLPSRPHAQSPLTSGDLLLWPRPDSLVPATFFSSSSIGVYSLWLQLMNDFVLPSFSSLSFKAPFESIPASSPQDPIHLLDIVMEVLLPCLCTSGAFLIFPETDDSLTRMAEMSYVAYSSALYYVISSLSLEGPVRLMVVARLVDVLKRFSQELDSELLGTDETDHIFDWRRFYFVLDALSCLLLSANVENTCKANASKRRPQLGETRLRFLTNLEIPVNEIAALLESRGLDQLLLAILKKIVSSPKITILSYRLYMRPQKCVDGYLPDLLLFCLRFTAFYASSLDLWIQNLLDQLQSGQSTSVRSLDRTSFYALNIMDAVDSLVKQASSSSFENREQTNAMPATSFRTPLSYLGDAPTPSPSFSSSSSSSSESVSSSSSKRSSWMSREAYSDYEDEQFFHPILRDGENDEFEGLEDGEEAYDFFEEVDESIGSDEDTSESSNEESDSDASSEDFTTQRHLSHHVLGHHTVHGHSDIIRDNEESEDNSDTEGSSDNSSDNSSSSEYSDSTQIDSEENSEQEGFGPEFNHDIPHMSDNNQLRSLEMMLETQSPTQRLFTKTNEVSSYRDAERFFYRSLQHQFVSRPNVSNIYKRIGLLNQSNNGIQQDLGLFIGADDFYYVNDALASSVVGLDHMEIKRVYRKYTRRARSKQLASEGHNPYNDFKPPTTYQAEVDMPEPSDVESLTIRDRAERRMAMKLRTLALWPWTNPRLWGLQQDASYYFLHNIFLDYFPSFLRCLREAFWVSHIQPYHEIAEYTKTFLQKFIQDRTKHSRRLFYRPFFHLKIEVARSFLAYAAQQVVPLPLEWEVATRLGYMVIDHLPKPVDKLMGMEEDKPDGPWPEMMVNKLREYIDIFLSHLNISCPDALLDRAGGTILNDYFRDPFLKLLLDAIVFLLMTYSLDGTDSLLSSSMPSIQKSAKLAIMNKILQDLLGLVQYMPLTHASYLVNLVTVIQTLFSLSDNYFHQNDLFGYSTMDQLGRLLIPGTSPFSNNPLFKSLLVQNASLLLMFSTPSTANLRHTSLHDAGEEIKELISLSLSPQTNQLLAPLRPDDAQGIPTIERLQSIIGFARTLLPSQALRSQDLDDFNASLVSLMQWLTDCTQQLHSHVARELKSLHLSNQASCNFPLISSSSAELRLRHLLAEMASLLVAFAIRTTAGSATGDKIAKSVRQWAFVAINSDTIDLIERVFRDLHGEILQQIADMREPKLSDSRSVVTRVQHMESHLTRLLQWILPLLEAHLMAIEINHTVESCLTDNSSLRLKSLYSFNNNSNPEHPHFQYSGASHGSEQISSVFESWKFQLNGPTILPPTGSGTDSNYLWENRILQFQAQHMNVLSQSTVVVPAWKKSWTSFVELVKPQLNILFRRRVRLLDDGFKILLYDAEFSHILDFSTKRKYLDLLVHRLKRIRTRHYVDHFINSVPIESEPQNAPSVSLDAPSHNNSNSAIWSEGFHPSLANNASLNANSQSQEGRYERENPGNENNNQSIEDEEAESDDDDVVPLQLDRENILELTLAAFNSLTPKKLVRSHFDISFSNEEGIDAGGLTREWVTLVIRKLFDPNYGLFEKNEKDKVSYQPHPFSQEANAHHLKYFEFFGSFIAKCLVEHIVMDVQFTPLIYKHILRRPLTFKDLELLDPQYFRSLTELLERPLEDLGLQDTLTFSKSSRIFGKEVVVDLVPNGSHIFVDESNKFEYVYRLAEHYLVSSYQLQMNAIIRGFYKLLPYEVVAFLQPYELELMLCGQPDVDVLDLRQNTQYHGYQASDSTIQAFWSVLDGLTKEETTLFLQFVTGSRKVPLDGFQSLRGSEGQLQLFSIHRVEDTRLLPTAHTCFNQLDLPDYQNQAELKSKLIVAIRECSEGFGFG